MVDSWSWEKWNWGSVQIQREAQLKKYVHDALQEDEVRYGGFDGHYSCEVHTSKGIHSDPRVTYFKGDSILDDMPFEFWDLLDVSLGQR